MKHVPRGEALAMPEGSPPVSHPIPGSEDRAPAKKAPKPQKPRKVEKRQRGRKG